jgi:hypothetical protein
MTAAISHRWQTSTPWVERGHVLGCGSGNVNFNETPRSWISAALRRTTWQGHDRIVRSTTS